MRYLFWALLLCIACATPPPKVAENSPTGTVEVVAVAFGGAVEEPSEYDRAEWGRWADADGDCQDTRQEVLIEESLDPAVLDEKQCRVVSGRWVDPYTGETFTDPSKLDIDHVVALKAAYDAGGSAWSPDMKEAYFNVLDNPNHLRAVSASANRSKGSKRPDEWMPPNEAFHCQYLKDWVGVKTAWELNYTQEEAVFLVKKLAACLPEQPAETAAQHVPQGG